MRLPPVQARTFLYEVQALRALAVTLVVAYHFWPDFLTGGYVGVDAFFVISGFLITSHLNREIASRGTVSLRAFYARRARRLLPAALLVLATTLGAGVLFLPVTRWASTAHDVLASAFYVQNWNLAGRATEYSTSNDSASALQHFWSLSVEEQFYLAWPSMILLLLVASRFLGRYRRPELVLPGIIAATAISLGYSVYETAHDRAAAYFVTPTRLWELGVGAVLALWMARGESGRAPRERRAVAPRMALRWGGLAAVLGCAVLFSDSTPFPGWTALGPVLGTAAVIAGGDTGQRDPLSRVLAARPAQFLGNVSYALYLWHWPVAVLAPFALHGPLTTWDKVALVAGCIGVAWLTKTFVEDPPQRWKPLRRPVVTAAATALAMLVVAGAALLQLQAVDRQQDAGRAQLASAERDPCFGAPALGSAAGECTDPYRPPATATLSVEDEPWFSDPACSVTDTPVHQADCRFSADPPTRRVALVGDSHAEHWRAAVHRIAQQFNWEVVEYLKGGCPATDAQVTAYNGAPVDTADCAAWGRTVDQAVVAGHFDDVLTSSFTTAYTFAASGGDSRTAGARGFATTWQRWAGSGAHVFVLRDIPTTGGRSVPECLATHPGRPLDCSEPRADALVVDAATVAASIEGAHPVRLVDMTSHFCDSSTCYAVIGGAQVYWDVNHMTSQFGRTLAPYLFDALRPDLG